MKRIYIKISVVCFLAGVFLFANITYGSLIIGLLWFVFLYIIVVPKKYFIFAVLVLIFVPAGFLRFYFFTHEIDFSSVHYYQNEDTARTMRGTMIENPDKRREKVNYIINIEQIHLNGRWSNVSGRILISTDLYPEFEYGDFVEIKGFLKPPAEFEGFSYKNYLSLFNVYSVVYRPFIQKLDSGRASLFFSVLFSVKEKFETRINELFPEPMASFSAGLLTGSRKGIPDELMTSFNITGLTHIIAISGYNISLIIFFVSSLFSKSSRKIKVPAIMLFIVLFTLFVGASPAVVRASIMGIISVLALALGRQSQVLDALLLSAFVMVCSNPNVLLYDVGFQLSFLATLGLILTGEKIKKFFSFVPDCLGIREGLAMTLSAQIFALPVIVLNFGRLSVISPVANILIVPFIPFAMLFGFCAVIASWINFSLGFLITFPGWLALKWMAETASVLSKIPFASVEAQWFNIYYFVGYYLFIILFANLVNHNVRNFLCLIRGFYMNRSPSRDIKGV